MNWLIFTIISIFFRAVYGVSTKVLSSNVKVSPATVSVIFSTFATLLTLIISPLIGGISFKEFRSVWLLAMVVVIAISSGNILYYKGIKSLDSSTTQIAFSSILIWGTLFSITFLNSNFSSRQIVGIILLLLAIIFVQFKKGVNLLKKGVLYIILSALIFAIFQISTAELSKSISAATYLLTAYLGTTIVTGILYAKTIRKDLFLLKNRMLQTSKVMLFSSITSLIHFSFAYFAYRSAPDSGVVVVLLTSQVIIAVILSIIFLKERDRIGRKLVAGLLAVLAGFLIKG
ncbi:MAG TPA: DMT family transporter [Candidatus Limnocylindrales bacterium]|nr:DMT family transporter [Candidatus Limnocylindrales bacterium]